MNAHEMAKAFGLKLRVLKDGDEATIDSIPVTPYVAARAHPKRLRTFRFGEMLGVPLGQSGSLVWQCPLTVPIYVVQAVIFGGVDMGVLCDFPLGAGNETHDDDWLATNDDHYGPRAHVASSNLDTGFMYPCHFIINPQDKIRLWASASKSYGVPDAAGMVAAGMMVYYVSTEPL